MIVLHCFQRLSFRLFVIVFLFNAGISKGTFLSVDPLYQFNSLFEYIANDPIQKVDRNGKGWEDAVSADMGNYTIEIDMKTKLHSSKWTMVEKEEPTAVNLNQYAARARSRNGNYSGEFRVSLIDKFEEDYRAGEFARAGKYMMEHSFANCSSFALKTFEKGVLLTTRSTPLPILEHPDLFESLTSAPVFIKDATMVAESNDIVTEYNSITGVPGRYRYTHTTRVLSNGRALNKAVFEHKPGLTIKPSQHNYEDWSRYHSPRITKHVRLFRPTS